jgi:anti-sigma B factor antagonist
MTIRKTSNGTALTLAVEGRLETTTAPELEAVVNNEIADVTDLTFDFAALEYISSAGLRVLLSAQKKMSAHGTMKIIHVNEIVNEVFEITGFSSILTIE